jgi:tRNA G10  N-methylase Trm11
MYIALLGRQPALGIAELERVYGSERVAWHGPLSATVDTDSIDIQKLGGTTKAGEVIAELNGNWHQISKKIVSHYTQTWSKAEGKITLGISVYGFDISPREAQKTGIILKQKLKQSGVALRLIPNQEAALSTATSHHNKLGLSSNKVELLVIRSPKGRVIIAESTGAQNITAYAKRDQGRPKRDAFVGMLPPKLAQIMINLAHPADGLRILDPFCGTGVVLQEAALLGHPIYGTDLADKMVDYSTKNLQWLEENYRLTLKATVAQGDAMTTTWQQPVDAVIGETYLGQPFSAPPSPSKLREVRGNCEHIIGAFLKNISAQLQPGTPLCIAVPAWKDSAGRFTHLPLTNNLESYGFTQIEFRNIKPADLLYFREDQVVARELLVLERR